MSPSHDVENVQTGKLRNKNVLLIACAVAVVVILTAVFGAVYFSSGTLDVEAPRTQNSPSVTCTGSNGTGTEGSSSRPQSYDSDATPDGEGSAPQNLDVASVDEETGTETSALQSPYPIVAVSEEEETDAGASIPQYSDPDPDSVDSDNEETDIEASINNQYSSSGCDSEALLSSFSENDPHHVSDAAHDEYVTPTALEYFILPHGSISEEEAEGAGTVPDEGEQMFVMYDPTCVESLSSRCELVLYMKVLDPNPIPITGQDSDPNPSGLVRHNFNAQVSPDGQVIAFIRTYEGATEENIMFFYREKDEFKTFILAGSYGLHFSFTPDSKGSKIGIVYTANYGHEIRRVDFSDDESNFKVSDPIISTSNSERIHSPVILEDETLFYYVNFNENDSDEYKVCMKKIDMEPPKCWRNVFENNFVNRFEYPVKLIPHGNIVYCLERKGRIWKINTSVIDVNNNVKPTFEFFTVFGYYDFFNGVISEDGKFLYLIVNAVYNGPKQLIKVTIKTEYDLKIVMPDVEASRTQNSSVTCIGSASNENGNGTEGSSSKPKNYDSDATSDDEDSAPQNLDVALKSQNLHLGSASATGPGSAHTPVPVPTPTSTPTPAPSVYDGVHDVLVMHDPDCVEQNIRDCELVLFNIDTQRKVTLKGPGNTKLTSNFYVQVSPDGKVIGVNTRKVHGTYDSSSSSGYSVRLFDREGKFLKELQLPKMYDYKFSFTPDSNGIIYSENNGKDIQLTDLNSGETGNLLEESDEIEIIMSPVLLKNGTVVLFLMLLTGYRWQVCMMKNGDRNTIHCWDYNQPLVKLIPFGNFVYCIERGGTISKIDTDSDTKIEFESGRDHLLDGTISEDGKILYLFAKNNFSALVFDTNDLIKINIESALASKNVQITGYEIAIPLIMGNIVALVPTLREV